MVQAGNNMSKMYKSRASAQRQAKKLGGRVVRRDRFGRFNKRGRHWSVTAPKRKPSPKRPQPKAPEKKRKKPELLRNEWHIKVSYIGHPAFRGGKHDIIIDAVFSSTKPVSKPEAEMLIGRISNGEKIKGARIRSIIWRHGTQARGITGAQTDFPQFRFLLNDPRNYEVHAEEGGTDDKH